MSELLTALTERGPEIWLRTLEHLMLTGVSTLAAVAVGVPLGVLAFFRTGLRSALMSFVGILQTIPSLAMLALLLVAFGRIGAAPALAALTLYALLPVVRNTLVGLEGIDESVAEAARGLGMTRMQELTRVRLPLALPVLAAGVRTAAVIGVGIATLSAFIGAGGLGQFINRGLALSDTGLILLGAVPAGILALIVDGSIAGLEWAADARRHRDHRGIGRRMLRLTAGVLPCALLLVPTALLYAGVRGDGDAAQVRICSKNFTEQLVLGELMAQVIERRTDLTVDRRFNMGGTVICHGALASGEVDAYAEYTGTALTAILEEELPGSDERAEDVFQRVRDRYEELFGVWWLPPFGFDNTYVLLAHPRTADSLGWQRVSDLGSAAASLSVGFTAEFAERPDGYPGFTDHYGFRFGTERDLDPGILYRAVADGEVDVVFGFATDGRIDSYGLVVLEDDRGFFPPYQAAPLARMEVLEAFPDLGPALRSLEGALPDSTMRRLNRQADAGEGSVAAIVRAFLDARDATP
ncbi:MAG: glycine betaine ABC transporter substrate-binding protein [Gemmatimonadota bacterium]